MGKILNLETATTNCSVSVAVNGEVVSLIEENTLNYSHSEQLHVFAEDALKKASLKWGEIDAIAVSKGPGSYTGLRIGVSAAKGLCFALDIPLISVPTLASMAHQIEGVDNDVIIPVLDARRMEVYSCVFDQTYNEIRETRAEIVTEDSFKEYLPYNNIHLVGNGATKCAEILTDPTFVFHPEVFPSSKEMAEISYVKYLNKDFEDVAYFEPYYLKDFVLQKKKT
ncbi:tRNA (adenosine(37)-N6)-threonylcarbamoyltransferase complex dimerization subunit type 1 TsaB [uncultured Croceitalea sp.]|uniref:tRNA (adenosine(37)-N6)-threonylcarbamoyltransferase complex dimerization subunit type 1 TsaB n=1 Tax=uncultured Croceitalea sp. TaxID=1798908 RepID=UPI0033067D8D